MPAVTSGRVSSMAASEAELIAKAKAGDLIAKNTLIRNYMPVIRQRIRIYARAPVPTAAMEGEAIKLLLYAVSRFNPNQGVAFRTFLGHSLQGLYRYVGQHKNIARIPEHQLLQITRFKNTKAILQTDKGREPTSGELADALGWSPQQVIRMDSAISRRDIAMSGIETLHEVEKFDKRMEDLMEFEYFSMNPDEKLVYDYSMGRHGKPRLADVKDIARRTSLTTDKIYSIKRTIAKRIRVRI